MEKLQLERCNSIVQSLQFLTKLQLIGTSEQPSRDVSLLFGLDAIGTEMGHSGP